MSLLLAGILNMLADLAYGLFLVCVLVSLASVLALGAVMAHDRISDFLAERRERAGRDRRWSEVENARKDLILDEHIARNRERVGMPQEHIAGRRAS